MSAGRLFVVATPLGNLGDISERALRTLREAQLIAAEDTRHSRKLLNHFAIDTAITSYHDHNEHEKTPELISRMKAGNDIALISDAGTPCVSDPGFRLVRAAREAGIAVLAIPGPSAPIAALSVSGLPSDRFTFYGFFPRKQGDTQKLLDEIRMAGGTHLFLESPQRILKTLNAIAAAMPAADVCVARELTKLYEQVLTGTPQELVEAFEQNEARGECVVILHINKDQLVADVSDEDLRERVQTVINERGVSVRDAVQAVAAEYGIPKNRVYAAAVREET